MKIQVITHGTFLTDWMRELVERRIQRALGRFTHRINEAIVTIEDLNGPRGGRDIECRIRLFLHPRGEINVAAVDATAHVALRDAAQRARRRIKTPTFAWNHDAGGADRFQIRGLRLRQNIGRNV